MNANANDLINQYKHLKTKERNSTFHGIDAIDLVGVCIDLGKLGYILSDDKSTWIKPIKVKPTDDKYDFSALKNRS